MNGTLLSIYHVKTVRNIRQNFMENNKLTMYSGEVYVQDSDLYTPYYLLFRLTLLHSLLSDKIFGVSLKLLYPNKKNSRK